MKYLSCTNQVNQKKEIKCIKKLLRLVILVGMPCLMTIFNSGNSAENANNSTQVANNQSSNEGVNYIKISENIGTAQNVKLLCQAARAMRGGSIEPVPPEYQRVFDEIRAQIKPGVTNIIQYQPQDNTATSNNTNINNTTQINPTNSQINNTDANTNNSTSNNSSNTNTADINNNISSNNNIDPNTNASINPTNNVSNQQDNNIIDTNSNINNSDNTIINQTINIEPETDNTGKNILRNDGQSTNIPEVNNINIANLYKSISDNKKFEMLKKISLIKRGKWSESDIPEEDKELFNIINGQAKSGKNINVLAQSNLLSSNNSNVNNKQFDLLRKTAEYKKTNNLQNIPEEEQPLIQALADKVVEGNVTNVIGSITDNRSMDAHKQVFEKININAMSVPTEVIPENYKDSFQETTFTSVHNSNDVQKATEIPLYATNGFSNAKIVGFANCQDITADQQAEADKMREIRTQDISSTGDEEWRGRVQKTIVEEEINTDRNTDSNGNQQSTNGQQKKLKPKTILRNARPLETIQEDQKENDNSAENNSVDNKAENQTITLHSQPTLSQTNINSNFQPVEITRNQTIDEVENNSENNNNITISDINAAQSNDNHSISHTINDLTVADIGGVPSESGENNYINKDNSEVIKLLTNNQSTVINNTNSSNQKLRSNTPYTTNVLYSNNNEDGNANNVILRAADDNQDNTKLINNVTIGTTDANDVNKFTVSNEKVEIDNIRVGENDKFKIEANNKECNIGTISMNNNAEMEYHGQGNPTIKKLNAPESGVFHIDQSNENGKMTHIHIDNIDVDQENADEQLLRNNTGVLRGATTILRDGNTSPSPQGTTTNISFDADYKMVLDSGELILQHQENTIGTIGNSIQNLVLDIKFNMDAFTSSVEQYKDQMTAPYYETTFTSRNTYDSIKDKLTSQLNKLKNDLSTDASDVQIKNSKGEIYDIVINKNILYLVKVTDKNKTFIENAYKRGTDKNNIGVVSSEILNDILEGAKFVKDDPQDTSKDNSGSSNTPTNTNNDDANTNDDDRKEISTSDIPNVVENELKSSEYDGILYNSEMSQLIENDYNTGNYGNKLTKALVKKIISDPASKFNTYCADLKYKKTSNKDILNTVFDDDFMYLFSKDNASKKKLWMKGNVAGINNNEYSSNNVWIGGDILTNSNVKLQFVGGTAFGKVKHRNSEYKARELMIGPKLSFFNKYAAAELFGLYRHNNIGYSGDNKNEFVNNGFSIGGKLGANINIADEFVVQPYLKALYSQLISNKPIKDLTTKHQFDVAPGVAIGAKLPADSSIMAYYQHNLTPRLKDKQGKDLINPDQKGSNVLGVGINKVINNSIEIGAKVSLESNNDDNKQNNDVNIGAQLQVSKLL